mmetsp:Transcript_10422/g.15609  ORF Transcript_10422/g.15609 Transcript_10422/m.15609 type:complete len:183 (+) Transcript_10422:123-671(+)
MASVVASILRTTASRVPPRTLARGAQNACATRFDAISKLSAPVPGTFVQQAARAISTSQASRGPNMDAARSMEDSRARGEKPNASVVTMEKGDAEAELDISSWGIWEKEVSTFDWFYGGTELMYILEGAASVQPTGDWSSCQAVSFKAGDLVTFPAGMTATWTVKAPIKKHFNFPFGKPLAK